MTSLREKNRNAKLWSRQQIQQNHQMFPMDNKSNKGQAICLFLDHNQFIQITPQYNVYYSGDQEQSLWSTSNYTFLNAPQNLLRLSRMVIDDRRTIII